MKNHSFIISLVFSFSFSCSIFSSVGITEEEKTLSATFVKVMEAGSLSSLLTQSQQDTCQHLIVSGKISSADIKVLRRMAGADGCGRLRVLNLMDVEIAPSEEPYLTIRRAEETVSIRLSEERILSLNIFPNGGDELGELQHANFFLQNHTDKSLDSVTVLQNLSQWKKMARQRLKFKGHRVSKDKDGHYTYSAFTKKGLFCEDMFYRCPSLQLVILPQKGKIYDRVVIVGETVRYKEVTTVGK